MKKKIYFIIASIIQIILGLCIIIYASSIVETQLQMLVESESVISSELIEREKTMLENGGEILVRGQAIVGIAMNILILNEVQKNNIVKKKGKLIGLSGVCLFFGQNIIISIISIINIIILLFTKRKNPEDFPEKIEIPQGEYQTSTKKEKILGILLVLLYFLIPTLIGVLAGILISILNLFNISELLIMAQVVSDIIVLLIGILIFKQTLKKHLKLFKENAKKYIKYILPKLGIIYAIYFTASFICIFISGEATSANQETLELLPKWYLIFAGIISAPIVEELIFRGVLRRFIKNNKIFIITSAIIFGLAHSITEASLSNIIIMAIPYAILGGGWAYIYVKTDNITNNILAHLFQNTIASIITMFI